MRQKICLFLIYLYLLFSVKINNSYFEFQGRVWRYSLSISLSSISKVWWNSEHSSLSLL
jgi:hypothetical protein